MAKKKKEKSNQPSLLKSLLVGGVMASGIGYLGVSLFNSLSNGIELLDALMSYKWNYEWLQSQEKQIRYGIYASPLVFGIIFKAFNRKTSDTYSDAADHGVFGDAEFSDLEDLKEHKFVPEDKKVGYFKKESVTKWSEDFWKTLKIPEGIILGRQDDELVVLHPKSKLDNRNVLVVGSSGSSKGQAFVIPNLINNYTSSMIVTDPKGELYHLLGDIKRDQGYAVHQVDFFNLVGSRYNPLDYVETDMDAKKVADSISRNSSKDGKEDFFFNTARDLLVGLILYAKSLNENASMRDVKRLFNKISDSETGEEALFSMLDKMGEDHPAFQFLADASSLGGNTRASVMSSFAQQTGVFSMQAVARFTETSDFKFEDMQKEKTIVFVKVPVKDNPVAGLTATFFDQLFSILYKIGDEHGSILPIPTICLLDEFANLGKLNDYDNILSTCRGYRLSLITVIQDFAQLEEKYNEKLARTFVNNHDTSLFLRTKDQKTAEYYEASAGDTTVRYETKSNQSGSNWLYYLGFDSQPKQNSPSRSENYQKKSLVSKTTLLNMTGETCYVFMAGRVLELEKAFQSKIYKGFITASEPVDEKYPYVYPKFREKYIDLLGLEPKEEQPTVEVERKNKPILPKQDDNEGGVNEGETASSDDSVVTTTEKDTKGSDEGISLYAKSLVSKHEIFGSTRSSKEEVTEPDKDMENVEDASKAPGSEKVVREGSGEVEANTGDSSSLKQQQAHAYSVLTSVDNGEFEIDEKESSETATDLLQAIRGGITTVRKTYDAELVAEGSDDMNDAMGVDEITDMMNVKGSLMQSEDSTESEEDREDQQSSGNDEVDETEELPQ